MHHPQVGAIYKLEQSTSWIETIYKLELECIIRKLEQINEDSFYLLVRRIGKSQDQRFWRTSAVRVTDAKVARNSRA